MSRQMEMSQMMMAAARNTDRVPAAATLSVVLFLAFSLTAGAGLEDGLEARVTAYWDFLVAQDKAAAMQFVAPESRNHFINRREPMMLKWELVKVEPVSDSEAWVEVRVDRRIPGVAGVHATEVVERWVRREAAWLVVIPAPALLVAGSPRSLDEPAERRFAAGEISFAPAVLRIPFFNPRRLGSVYLNNGLDHEVVVRRIELDRERFSVVEAPETIPAGQRRKLVLEYTGDEVPKNLPSTVKLMLQSSGGSERAVEVPMIYNYFSEGARALFGLTREQAEQVRRGDKPVPAVSIPATFENREKVREPRPRQETRPPVSTSSGGNDPRRIRVLEYTDL